MRVHLARQGARLLKIGGLRESRLRPFMPVGRGWPVILAKAGPASLSITSRALPIRQYSCCRLPDLPPSPAALHGFLGIVPEISHARETGWIELS